MVSYLYLVFLHGKWLLLLVDLRTLLIPLEWRHERIQAEKNLAGEER